MLSARSVRLLEELVVAENGTLCLTGKGDGPA